MKWTSTLSIQQQNPDLVSRSLCAPGANEHYGKY
jgi:hypothetical protein